MALEAQQPAAMPERAVVALEQIAKEMVQVAHCLEMLAAHKRPGTASPTPKAPLT